MPQTQIANKDIEVLVEKYFKDEVLSIDKVNNGNYNQVFIVRIKSEHDDIVIRASDQPSKINDYLKEQWCIAIAKEKGVAVADVLEVNNSVIAFPYMIQKRVRGITANEYVGDKEKIWREMGQIASIINSIVTQGYGSVFDWSKNKLSKLNNWKEYLDKELDVNATLDLYSQNKILTKSNFKKVQKNLDEIYKWDFSPRLCHNDLLLKNVMVDNEGTVQYIIDWELAISSKAPQFELAKTLPDLSNKERMWFIKGYGMTEQEYQHMLPNIISINVLYSKGYLKYLLRENMDKEIEKLRLSLNTKLNEI